MATSNKTPYQILDVPHDISYVELRGIYRAKIHEHKQKKISGAEFGRICRAYETLSDFDKRKRYDSDEEWISELSLAKYTPQQLAAESDLILSLKERLSNATLTEVNAKDLLTGHTTLYCAARAGNVEAVMFLTEQGAEPDLYQRTKSTALHAAAFYGHADVVRCLLECGADYRKTNMGDHTAKQEAFNKDVERVFAELKQMPYVQAAADQLEWFLNNDFKQHIDEQYYTSRQTLLQCACKKGYFRLVRWLVEERSANLDIVDVNLNSALHLAAYGGHIPIVEYLLNHGCNSTLKSRWGTTAENEGSKHGNRITNLFESMRQEDMFQMARDGIVWWFQYYFDGYSSDAADSRGTSLLYHACRYGQISVAKWLLEQGANVNIQMQNRPRSTPLHGAKYHGHASTVELLLEYGADINIRNDFGTTVFEESISEEVDEDSSSKINELLHQYRRHLNSDKVIDIYVYEDDDQGQEPIAKVKLGFEASLQDLLEALPDISNSQNCYFSIARRSLYFNKDTTIIQAVYRARYACSKLIDTPLRLTCHKTQTNKTSQQIIRKDPVLNMRIFQGELENRGKLHYFSLKSPMTDKKTFNAGDLTFTFSAGCIKSNISLEVRTICSSNVELSDLPGCICLFQIKNDKKDSELLELPLVSMANDSQARLYTLAKGSSYWFGTEMRRNRLSKLDGIHAFVRHVDIIPKLLTLPADMLSAKALGQPLVSLQYPIDCTCLMINEPDTINFPHTAYHGTNIAFIRSILTDGLVVPGTVVSNGKRINPPSYHIARGTWVFHVPDFAAAIFLSPSVHYCSDSTYAVAFSHDDQQLLPVLQCSVKANSFHLYQCTVPTYQAHLGDDLNAIEWRITDPANVVINAVLFIPKIDSIKASRRDRMSKIIPNLNDE